MMLLLYNGGPTWWSPNQKVPEQFYTTSVRIGHPIAIEPEGGGRASDGNGMCLVL